MMNVYITDMENNTTICVNSRMECHNEVERSIYDSVLLLQDSIVMGCFIGSLKEYKK